MNPLRYFGDGEVPEWFAWCGGFAVVHRCLPVHSYSITYARAVAAAISLPLCVRY